VASKTDHKNKQKNDLIFNGFWVRKWSPNGPTMLLKINKKNNAKLIEKMMQK